jgi:signal recognition particle subunit SRP54
MVVKIVHDELVEMLGSDAEPIDLAAQPPVPLMLVGLQGSGKTTTCAKIGYRLTQRDKKKVLMASLDTRRPAAQEQLRVLGEQAKVDTLPIVPGQTPQQIARRAIEAARLAGYDVVLLDTAGRIHIDEELMRESAEVRDIATPHETLLVADSLTGQDAVRLARSFDERVGITGIVLTRVDGDGRGGAALSMRAVTGKPIKLIGVGERWDALEDFHPQRIAGRILGMGDVVSLVEKAAQSLDMEKAQAIAQKMRKGAFDLEDLAEQLKQMEKIGGMSGMMGLLPGVGKMKKQLDAANIDDRILKRQRAIISSMTPKERRNPKILDGKRKRRIAAGSGTKPEDVNKLIKMHRQMGDMMKAMGKQRGGLFQRMMGMGGGGGAAPSEAELERMRAELCRLDPKALEALPKDLKEQLPKGLPPPGAAGRPMPRLPGLPGLGGPMPPRFPGLPGLPGKKK